MKRNEIKISAANTTAFQSTQYTAGFSDVRMTFPNRLSHNFPAYLIAQLVRCTKITVAVKSGQNLGWAHQLNLGSAAPHLLSSCHEEEIFRPTRGKTEIPLAFGHVRATPFFITIIFN